MYLVSSTANSTAFNRKTDSSVNIRSFKEFVAKNYEESAPLYKILLSEKDQLSREEIAAKFDVWLKLVSISLPEGS